MTLQQLQKKIGALDAAAARLARRLEMADRLAEIHGNPGQAEAARDAARLRLALSDLYTQRHALEARIPTRETLAAAEYNRLLALGFQIEAAEAGRRQVWRDGAYHPRAA